MLVGIIAGPLLAKNTCFSTVLETTIVISTASQILLGCYYQMRLIVEIKYLKFEDFCDMLIVDTKIGIGRV